MKTGSEQCGQVITGRNSEVAVKGSSIGSRRKKLCLIINVSKTKCQLPVTGVPTCVTARNRAERGRGSRATIACKEPKYKG